MPWQNEMKVIVRHLVNDLDSSDYTFTDSRLEEAVLVSAQLASLEIDFDNTYAIDVDSVSLSPDPTSGNKDDSFINLVCLKTAQMLLGSELKTHSLNAISLKDGPSALDLRGIVSVLKFCLMISIKNMKKPQLSTNSMVLLVKPYLGLIHREVML